MLRKDMPGVTADDAAEAIAQADAILRAAGLSTYEAVLRLFLTAEAAQQPANDEVVFIDGVGAGRRSVESCRDGVQWIMVGDRVYWPLSESDAKRLQSACCGNGQFDGPASSAGEGEQQ